VSRVLAEAAVAYPAIASNVRRARGREAVPAVAQKRSAVVEAVTERSVGNGNHPEWKVYKRGKQQRCGKRKQTETRCKSRMQRATAS